MSVRMWTVFVMLLLAPVVAFGQQAPVAPTPVKFLYVPYDREQGPRLGQENSVLLPYAEFLKLQGTTQPDAPDFKPSASISQASYQGSLINGVAEFNAEITIEVLARPKDEMIIPLPFRGASLSSVKVEGATTSLGSMQDGSGPEIRLIGGGQRKLLLTLAVVCRATEALRRIEFGAPRAAASQITLKCPEAVTLEQVEGSLPASVISKDDGTSEIHASGGGRDSYLLAFRTKVVMGKAAAEVRLSVEQTYNLRVGPRSAVADVYVKAVLLSGRTSSLEVKLPAGLRVLSLSGPFVRDWTGPDENGLLRVSSASEVSESFDFNLSLDLPLKQDSSTLDIPDIRVPSALREAGKISVSAEDGLAVWPEDLSGLQTAPAEIGYRAYAFGQPGWKLVLSIHPIPPRTRAESLLLYEISEEFIDLSYESTLSVIDRNIFDAFFTIPEGYTLREAGPSDRVSNYRQDGQEAQISFRGAQIGSFPLSLRLRKDRNSTDKTVPLQPVILKGAEEDSGFVVLATSRALRATETSSTGLQAADARSVSGRLQPIQSSAQTPVLGYRYFKPDFKADVLIERQHTRLSCETAILASIDPSLIRLDASLSYNVEFSATDEFHLLLPASVGEDVRFTGKDIKEKTRSLGSDADAWAKQGLARWTIRLQTRVIGPYSLGASFDVPLEGKETDAPVSVIIPKVRAAGVARETGYIAVSRGENLEVRVSRADGLETRDVKELPGMLSRAFLGFRTFTPESAELEISLVRHQLEGVPGAIIRRMHIDTVLSDQQEAIHEVFFEIQNNREQYLELKMPESIKVWSAFVRGVPVRSTTRQSDGARLIELTKSETADKAFRVRLVLRESLSGGKMKKCGKLNFQSPVPLNVPVLRFTRKLFLPRSYRYIGFGGEMQLVTGGRPPWIEPAAEKLLDDIPASATGGIPKESRAPQSVEAGASYDTNETDAEKQARLQGAALEIPIVREGLQFEFSKLSGVGDIEITYWKSKPLLLLQGILCLIVFCVLIVKMRTGDHLLYGVGAFLITLVGSGLTSGLAGHLFASALTATTAALVLAVFIYAARQSQEAKLLRAKELAAHHKSPEELG